jgi:hypothetical protein
MSLFASEFFKLVAVAAFYHDFEEDRCFLQAELGKWLGQLDGVPDRETIRSCITGEKGTPLEPFILQEEDVELAVFLAQVAFSDSVGETRIRIVSRDTIGNGGGLVLTNNLKSYFTERYAFGKNRHNLKVGWEFIPNFLKSLGSLKVLSQEASIMSDDVGFCISIPSLQIEPDDFQDALDSYQSNARIDGCDFDFSQLGLRVDRFQRGVKIVTGSPESIIRLMPALLDEKLLFLESDDDSLYPTVVVRLSMPDESKISLKAVYGNSPLNYKWINCGDVPDFDLTEDISQSICRWCRPHSDWLPEFTKLL